MKILRIIKRIMTWWPNEIFYTTEYDFHTYFYGHEKPRISLWWPAYYGDLRQSKEFTPLGKFFVEYTPLLEILKLPYYMLTLPVCSVPYILHGSQ